MNKLYIYGGGTFTKAKCHMALAAPAFGTTAKQLHTLCKSQLNDWDIGLILTKMADSTSNIVTNTDLYYNVSELIKDFSVKTIIFNAAVCDFYLGDLPDDERLSSDRNYEGISLLGETCKIIKLIKDSRPDIFVVGFKTTYNRTVEQQKVAANTQILNSNVDIVFANDLGTRSNIIVAKKGGVHINDREKLLSLLPTLILNGVKTGNSFEAFKCFQ